MTSIVRHVVAALTFIVVPVGSMLSPVAWAAEPSPDAAASGSPTASVSPSASAAATSQAVTHACDVWTADEVSSALGGDEITVQRASSGAPICFYVGTETAGDLTLGLYAGLTVGDASAGSLIDQVRQNLPDAEELTIGGLAAIPGPTQAGTGEAEGWSMTALYVFPDPTVMLELLLTAPDEVGGQAALASLVELATSRIASVQAAAPAPSPVASAAASSEPAPSTVAEAGLAGLFPTDIGGGPVSIDMDLSGPEYLSQIVNFKPMEQKVTKALKKRKLKASDLSFAIGSSGSGALIAAFQVKDTGIKPLVNVLLESLAMEKTGGPAPSGDVAGKDAFQVTSGFLLGGGTGYAYPKDDVLWLVFAFGPDNAEVFEKLP